MSLFTSEPYDKTKYIYEQLADRLFINSYSEEERKKGILYFGIPPPFVKYSMNGKFDNALVIAMGCNGLTYTGMAEAFIQKGAKAYISWNQPISAPHTDLATTHLLQHFLVEKRTLKEAVMETMKEVDIDPAYISLLIYYPPEVGDQTIEDITGNSTTKP